MLICLTCVKDSDVSGTVFRNMLDERGSLTLVGLVDLYFPNLSRCCILLTFGLTEGP